MKVAIFLEGQTEVEFVRHFIEAICGRRAVTYSFSKQVGGRIEHVEIQHADDAVVFVMLVNCQNDDQVKTQIKEQYDSLVRAGYTKIIGLRDVYPLKFSDVDKIERHLQTGVPKGKVDATMYLAVMEVESWFLDEITHFQRIDQQLTEASVVSAGYDIVNLRGKDWEHPAETLDAIYKLAGKRYRKKLRYIKRTVGALCANELYVSVRGRSESFDRFVTGLEDALF